VSLANIFAFKNDLKKTSANKADAVNIIRHAILTGIKMYKMKYGRMYGDVVIACDGRQYWRRSLFPYYKAGRSEQREKSDLDWTLVFDTIDTIRRDLAEHFPYKVIHLDHVEADDIIGALCKWTQTNGLVDYGVFEDKQPVMIISSDGDFKQLHKYPNVKQWSPIQKKIVTCDDPIRYLAAHIAKAGDDGIPNVLSEDNVFVTDNVRQTKMTSLRLDEFVERGRDACRNDTERRNWDRNNQLINLDLIPPEISTSIIDTYVGTKPKGDKMSVYRYLVNNNCRLLLNDIEEF